MTFATELCQSRIEFEITFCNACQLCDKLLKSNYGLKATFCSVQENRKQQCGQKCIPLNSILQYDGLKIQCMSLKCMNN